MRGYQLDEGTQMTIISNTWHLDSEARKRECIKNRISTAEFLQTISVLVNRSVHFIKTFITLIIC